MYYILLVGGGAQISVQCGVGLDIDIKPDPEARYPDTPIPKPDSPQPGPDNPNNSSCCPRQKARGLTRAI